jgi:hypothetical protein
MEPRAYNRFAIVPIYADSTGVAALRLGSIRRRHHPSVIARLLPTAPALQGWNSREKIS